MRKSNLFFSGILVLACLLVFLMTKDALAEVTIVSPQNNSNVRTPEIVSGTADIPSGEHLWLLARRYDFAPLWWPQREIIIDPKTHKWKASANLGEKQDVGFNFDIGVITVGTAEHNELMNYWRHAATTGDWRPIEIPEPTSKPRVITVKMISH